MVTIADTKIPIIQSMALLHEQLNSILDAIYTAFASAISAGSVTASGLTMATGKLLGRTTASAGAIEEITPGATLSLAAGALGIDLTHANTWPGAQTFAKPVTPALTFATLPATPVAGQRSFITDCNSTTFLANAAAGGSNKVPVLFDGANWVIG